MSESAIHLYLIPGLGVDHRLFKNLTFPSHVVPHFWNWEEPKPAESLAAYAHRYAKKINQQFPAVLLGVSFGGIIAQEIAKQVPVERVILISSLKNRNEIPWYFKLGKTLPIHTWISGQQVKTIGAKMQRALGDQGKGAQLFESMLANTPNYFMTWAIEQLIQWDQEQTPANVVHYHGTADQVLPSKYLSNFIPVVGGTHAMILVEAAKINEILGNELAKLMP